jgi:predicted ribosomally synthesized peptide with SipW-like signal peptide
MKKAALLCLALVLALGALGVGYAKWSDTVTMSGPVKTGKVCIGVRAGSAGEVFHGTPPFNDMNYTSFDSQLGTYSCPPGYQFNGIHEELKDVAHVTVVNELDTDGDGNIDTVEFTIEDAYPYLLMELSFVVCNCGTIPLKIQAPVITQDDGILIQYLDNVGVQLEPGACSAEISMYVGVPQYLSTGELTPQGATLHFSILVGGIQWAE